MHRLKSGMVWFEDEEWIGHKVSFDHQPCPSTWRLVQKIREREKYEPEHSWKSMEIPSEARGIFICEEEGQQYRQGVVKIYMQIPFYGTISEPQHIRSKQARTETDYLAQHEILALQSLTDAGCTSTPSLIAWKNTAQDDERYVPGGYLTYILMEKASGINLEDFDRLPREERDQVRVAFKSSWTECIKLGFVHLDKATRNLIWDKEQQKCYIIDWETWRESGARHYEWLDLMYLLWGLARRESNNDSLDMSTWML